MRCIDILGDRSKLARIDPNYQNYHEPSSDHSPIDKVHSPWFLLTIDSRDSYTMFLHPGKPDYRSLRTRFLRHQLNKTLLLHCLCIAYCHLVGQLQLS